MTIVPDFDRCFPVSGASGDTREARPVLGVGGSATFWRVKSIIDMAGALMLLCVVGVLAALLLLLNPMFNPGPVFYRQRRMGRDRVPFMALKFRTMRPVDVPRGPDDPVEFHRITPLGGLLRRMGLDEVPQAVNILRGEMSLIGPRPDCIHHAEAFLRDIPDYRARFAVRPGISGLAQVRLGYAVGTAATRAKARADLDYLSRASLTLDAYVIWRTVLTILTGRGD